MYHFGITINLIAGMWNGCFIMNNSNKLPEIRKEAFTKARENLGLSAKDLSGMSCFSVRQIEQIENGESSSFYGPQNKITAAKKVAELLKLKPEEAFEFSEAIQAPQLADAEKSSAIEKKAEEKKDIPAMAKVAESRAEKMSTRKMSEATVDYRVQSKAAVSPKKKIFLLLAIGAAIIFSVINLRPSFFPEPVKEEIVIIQEVAPEPAPTNTPAEPAAVEVKPTPAAAPPATPVASAECPAADSTPLNYKPDAPKKPGDMVFLQSKTVQTICVIDATGKVQNKTLEPGVGVSIYGKSPFKVITGGLNQVDLYYQGAKVRTGNASNKTIILEPAEIIQPAVPSNPTDSQLR